MRRSSTLLTLVTAALITGCAARQATPAALADQPVPAGEPRGELRARVDLEPGADCEERFDLALYESRAIDLIQWDGNRGSCGDRGITIRYLSAKVTSAEVESAAKAHSKKLTVVTRGEPR